MTPPVAVIFPLAVKKMPDPAVGTEVVRVGAAGRVKNERMEPVVVPEAFTEYART